jgi:hypothetical protein
MFHVADILIHVLLVFAVISLVLHFVMGRRHMQARTFLTLALAVLLSSSCVVGHNRVPEVRTRLLTTQE